MDRSKSKRSSSKLQSIKEISLEILSITTMHGIPNMIRTENFKIRILWTICLIVSSGSCGFFMITSILNFLQYDIVTVIYKSYEQASVFPTLSICNTMTKSYEIKVLKCLFNVNPCPPVYGPFYDTIYGNCFRFNGGFDVYNKSADLLSMTTGGIRYGLYLDLNITSAYNYNEISIFIHNNSVKPTNIKNKGYRISTGSINTFQIDRVYNLQLGEPYNDCFKNLEDVSSNRTIIDFIKSTNNSYGQVECIRICRNLKTLEESGCNCIVNLDSAAECQSNKNQSINDCYAAYLMEFQKRNIYSECADYCPLECDSFSYSIELYQEFLPSSGVINSSTTAFEFVNFKTFENVQKSYLQIRAFYQELNYLNIEQQPHIQMVDLVSSLGGTLGLFLGVSFLSFIEFVELLLEIVSILFKSNSSVSLLA